MKKKKIIPPPQIPGQADNPLLSRDDVMALLKIKPTSLHKLIKSKAFPYYRIGRRILVQWSDLRAFLEKHKVK